MKLILLLLLGTLVKAQHKPFTRNNLFSSRPNLLERPILYIDFWGRLRLNPLVKSDVQFNNVYQNNRPIGSYLYQKQKVETIPSEHKEIDLQKELKNQSLYQRLEDVKGTNRQTLIVN